MSRGTDVIKWCWEGVEPRGRVHPGGGVGSGPGLEVASCQGEVGDLARGSREFGVGGMPHDDDDNDTYLTPFRPSRLTAGLKTSLWDPDSKFSVSQHCEIESSVPKLPTCIFLIKQSRNVFFEGKRMKRLSRRLKPETEQSSARNQCHVSTFQLCGVHKRSLSGPK